MNLRRVVLAGTVVMLIGLAVALKVLRWDEASKVATAVSAVAGVAAVGIAVWAALPAFSGGGGRRISRTGKATAGLGGRANSGLAGAVGPLPDHQVRVDRTGDADASNGGDANTGIQLN